MSFLVDCGSGVTQRLIGAGSAGRDIDAVFLTHLHSDHVVDLYQLIVSSWHQGRTRPPQIYGPAGTRHFVDAIMGAWRRELDLRIAHERRPSTAALEPNIVEFEAGEIHSQQDLRVIAVEVDHRPVAPAYGFVFESSGRKLVFSGDTRYCAALIAAAQDCDVLVHECFIHREMKPIPGARTQEGIDAVASYHTLSTEVGQVAAEARAKCLVLNHFVPVRFDKATLLAEVRSAYGGPIVLGEDLMSLDLATGMLSHAGGVVGLRS